MSGGLFHPKWLLSTLLAGLGSSGLAQLLQPLDSAWKFICLFAVWAVVFMGVHILWIRHVGVD